MNSTEKEYRGLVKEAHALTDEAERLTVQLGTLLLRIRDIGSRADFIAKGVSDPVNWRALRRSLASKIAAVTRYGGLPQGVILTASSRKWFHETVGRNGTENIPSPVEDKQSA